MNKIVASVGVVALGAASVQAQSSMSAISGPSPKWWNISATVRGFYDDNANTAPNDLSGPAGPIATFGYDLNPSIGISLGDQQTTFNATYTYNFLYYEKRLVTVVNTNGVAAGGDKFDQNHDFNLLLSHAFSERYSLKVGDDFVIGQEPDMLRAGNAVNAFQRISGNNIVNSGTITFDGQLTPEFGFEVGYNNALYDYEAEELSGPLNRIENAAHLDARWTVSPDTVGVLGYQFGFVDYTGSGPASLFFTMPSPGVTKTNSIDIRNTISHTLYVGADHTFNPELVGSVRAGASYYDYYNDSGANDFGPYAQLSLSYMYASQSSATIGFQEGRQASSLIGNQATSSIVHDTETSVFYGSVVHRILPKLFGTVQGSFQDSIYHGGGAGIDGEADRFYQASVLLEYRFNPNIAVQAGYDYYRLCSSLKNVGDRNYDRNKVYIGATASY